MNIFVYQLSFKMYHKVFLAGLIFSCVLAFAGWFLQTYCSCLMTKLRGKALELVHSLCSKVFQILAQSCLQCTVSPDLKLLFLYN